MSKPAMGPNGGEDGDTAPLDSLLQRYHAKFRPGLRQLARRSPRHDDLLTSFPAASLSLVTKRGSARERGEAMDLVANGASLKTVARALRLPIWTRKLPPEALHARLPEEIAPDFKDAAFGRQVVGHLPEGARAARSWLRWVLESRAALGDPYAIWIAKRRMFATYAPGRALLDPLMAFAWFSEIESDASPRDRWTPDMSLVHAAHRTRDWILRIMLDICGFGAEPGSIWTETRQEGGHAFAPLLTALDLEREGKAMQNCAAVYKDEIALGRRRLYSVRRRGQRVATLEVRPRPGVEGALVLGQIRGPRNAMASAALRKTAGRWLEGVLREPDAAARFGVEHQRAVAIWRGVFEPYSKQTGVRSAFTRYPKRPAIARLLRDLEVMAEEEAFGRRFYRARR